MLSTITQRLSVLQLIRSVRTGTYFCKQYDEISFLISRRIPLTSSPDCFHVFCLQPGHLHAFVIGQMSIPGHSLAVTYFEFEVF